MRLKIITGESGTGIDPAAEPLVNRRRLAKLRSKTARTKPWLCALLFLSVFAQAQTNSPPGALYPANRFLLVVETSHAMAPRSEATARIVGDLLKSSFSGQARRGDSLGVWTFNEALYTGQLALQQWTPETQKAVTDRVVGFLLAQKLEKKSRLDKVIPSLNYVVKNSPFLTVILVCVGDEEVHGTPFDQRINAFFQSWRQQQLDARTPFVVALRSQAGAYADCSMNPAPWPPELPPLPRELLTPLPVARAPATEPKRAATSTVAPLIISGKKHDSPAALTNAAASVATTATPAPALTNSIPQSVAASGADKVAGPSGPAAATAPAIQPPTVAAPVLTSSPPPLAAAQIPLARVPEAATHTVPPPAAEPRETSTTPAAKTVKDPGPLAPMLAANAGTTAITSQTLAPSEPPPVQPKTVTPQPGQAANSEPVKPAVEVATVDPPRNERRWIILSLGGIITIGTMLVTIWMWRRKTRSTAGEVSLITESIDRHKR